MSASPTPAAYANLKSCFLEDVAPRDLRAILGAARQRRFFANSVVINQEDQARSLYLLVEGRARYFYITPEGQQLLLPWILPGENFGAAALLSRSSSYLVSTKTVKYCSILMWNKLTIRGLVQHFPTLLDNALSIAYEHLNWARATHIGLACYSARLRLAQALVNLFRDIGGNIREGIEIAVTNEELANAANVTPFTASRLLSEWHRRGALPKSRGKILLRFPQQLFTHEV